MTINEITKCSLKDILIDEIHFILTFEDLLKFC